MPNETRECVVCGQPIDGYGHNAAPVAEGQCCGGCNAEVVLPARLDGMRPAGE